MSSMQTKHAQDMPMTLLRSCWLGRPASAAEWLYTERSRRQKGTEGAGYATIGGLQNKAKAKQPAKRNLGCIVSRQLERPRQLC